MQPGIEQIIAGAIGLLAAGFAAFRFFGRRHIIRSYRQGRELRLHGDYERADQLLAVASVAYPSAQILRFWMMVERCRIDDAKVLLNAIPKTLSGQEGEVWLALRFDSLAKAEAEAAKLLHLMNATKPLPFMETSTLYTHACLLIEEGSHGYAVEKLSLAMHAARTAYGTDCVYAVPPAVALAYLNFLAGNFEKSAKLLANGLRAYRTGLGDEHPRTARVRAMLGVVAGAVGMDEPARKELSTAVQCFQQFDMTHTDDARTTQRALEWLRA